MQIREYVTADGFNPFCKWLRGLDSAVAMRIRARLTRIEVTGNLGDYKSIKRATGIYELRFKMRSGHRVYFGLDGDNLILLLVGGDKSSQRRDIEKAKSYWEDYHA